MEENSRACSKHWLLTSEAIGGFGSTNNYIDIREYAARGINTEAEDQVEELKMADGIVVRTEGRVQFIFKCDGYIGEISTRVFLKPKILGILWLSKENPHIY